MTKKEFKERCHHTVYTSRGVRIDAFLYGFKDYRYKYMVWSRTENCTKKELFDIMYEWCIEDKGLPWWVSFKKAETEEEMFKIPITLKG